MLASMCTVRPICWFSVSLAGWLMEFLCWNAGLFAFKMFIWLRWGSKGMFNASACGLWFSIVVRWKVLKPIVTWQAISFQRRIMTSVLGSCVIEHGLESYGKIDGSGWVHLDRHRASTKLVVWLYYVDSRQMWLADSDGWWTTQERMTLLVPDIVGGSMDVARD